MTDTEALRKRLHEIRWQLKGEARLAALEAHLTAVESDGDGPLLNATLAALVDCYEFSPDSTRLLVPFSRLLQGYDTAPEHFDAALQRSVYWQLKWVVYQLIDHPDVPLAAIEDWLGQMRRRYTEAGHSLHPYYEAEHWFAYHVGDAERAARAAALIDATEPDDMSDCEACRVNDIGDIAAKAGDFARAVEAWAPILGGALRCAHEPHATLADSLLPLAALGRLDEARANHLHGYRISRDKDDMVHFVARHVRFCALTGNEARAIEIIAADQRVFAMDVGPDVRLELLEGLQATAAALVARGLGDTALPGPENRSWTADALAAWADGQRRELCARYDRRNGNDVQSRLSQLRVEPEESYPHVPLGLRAMPQAPSTPVAAPATADAFEAALEKARQATVDAADDDDARWAEVARLAAVLGRDLDAADEAEVLLAQADPEADLEAAQALAARSAKLFLQAGNPGRALLCRGAATAWGVLEAPETAAARLEPLLDEAAELAVENPAAAARVRAELLIALLQAGLRLGKGPDEGLRAAFAEADADLAAVQDDRRVLRARATLALTASELESAPQARLKALYRAAAMAAEAGFAYETFVSAAQCASMLNGAGRFEESLRIARTGIAAIRPDLPPVPVASLYLSAAECSVNLGDHRDAEAHALQAAHWYDRAGEPGCAGVARHLLGRALGGQDRHEEAVIIFEAALTDLPSMPDEEHWRIADVRYLLAECYQRVRDPRSGLTHVAEALRLADDGLAHPNPGFGALAAHLAGELLEGNHDAAAAIDAYRRAERAWRDLGDLGAAANPARAAVWASLRTDDRGLDAALDAMRALEAELRAAWRGEEHDPEYRQSCRREVAKTLLQQSSLADQNDNASTEDWARMTLRLSEAALKVVEDGEPIPELAAEAAHNLVAAHGQLGDAAAAEAAAERVLPGLDAERHGDLRAALERHVAFVKERAER